MRERYPPSHRGPSHSHSPSRHSAILAGGAVEDAERAACSSLESLLTVIRAAYCVLTACMHPRCRSGPFAETPLGHSPALTHSRNHLPLVPTHLPVHRQGYQDLRRLQFQVRRRDLRILGRIRSCCFHFGGARLAMAELIAAVSAASEDSEGHIH